MYHFRHPYGEILINFPNFNNRMDYLLLIEILAIIAITLAFAIIGIIYMGTKNDELSKKLSEVMDFLKFIVSHI